ncbi:hypothetical protein [Allosalinactinospora lopnorensis]|uniref:hypothetical protein n=1 Tax=Allosalinactinospora lopnorensis TaxID=1352348 RepID=UPI000623FBDC|nr:hypothetical protein [Allosalinactinospora lopnorensis]
MEGVHRGWTPLSIPLNDGDELLNAAAVAEHLGIKWGTLLAHLGQRETAARPFPDPEDDPVALIVADEEVAKAVRKLLSMAGNKRSEGVPQVWRKSRIDTWDSQRIRRRPT